MNKINKQTSLFEALKLTNYDYLAALEEETIFFDNQKKLLDCYSTFDAEMIGNIISQLMSINEEKKFSYQTANHKTYVYESTILGMGVFNVTKKLNMIVNENEKQVNYSDLNKNDNTVQKLVNDGDALVLSNNKYSYDKKIKFYTFNDGALINLVDFSKFPYIKEFIDIVIQYRYENKLENISEKELLNMMKQFILNKNKTIDEKDANRIQQKLLFNNKSQF